MTEINIERYRKQFYREAREILDKVYDDILKAEAEPTNPELLNSIFRGVHTIKGSIGIFELESVSLFSHQLEGLLNDIREGKIELNSEIVDVLLAGVDHISKMIRDHESGKDPVTDAELVEQFIAFRGMEQTAAEPAPECIPETEKPVRNTVDISDLKVAPDIRDQLQKLANRGFNVFNIRLNYTSEHLANGYDPFVFLKKLRQVCHFYQASPFGEEVSESCRIPALDSFDPMTLYLQTHIVAASENSYESVIDLAFDPSLVIADEVAVCRIETREYEAPEIVDAESLKEFILGSSEMIESAEHAVIEFESSGSVAALNEIFRVVHNIKGDADFIGLKRLNTFAHTLESLLEKLRSGIVIKDAADIIFKSVDYLWNCVRKLNQGMEITDFPPVYETLKKYSELKNKPAKKSDSAADDSEVRLVFSDQIFQYKSVIAPNIENASINPTRKAIILRAVKGLANAANAIKNHRLRDIALTAADIMKTGDADAIVRSLTDLIAFLDQMEVEPRRIGEILIQEGKLSETDLNQCLAEQKKIGEILVKAGKVSEEDVELALKRQETIESSRQTKIKQSPDLEIRSMRVDESKIEQLTNIAGELMIARNAYDYILNRLNKTGTDREVLKAMKDNLHLFSRLTNDIHYKVMSLRMIPVGGVFRKFTRIVRDIGRKQRKSIDLAVEGETMEIDKKAADALTDPLVHLIRNACDHGIETASERIACGKPEKGTLTIKAYRKGVHLCISVSDDGRGISRQKLYEKGIALGFDSGSPDNPDILDLIFLPGLTTMTESTDLSGRGVGMDVVKTTVQSLGGAVKVSSEEGKGTEVILFIPMTMGIESVMMVQISGTSYAIPLAYIESTLKIPAKKVRSAVHRTVFYHRGDVIPLERLDVVLSGKPSGTLKKSDTRRLRNNYSDDEEISIVILRTGRGKLGVIVDQFVKNTELAIKPLPTQLAGLKIASGVSIMGDGKIILMLNPDHLTF